MDVTNENFKDILPEIRETIQGCNFISIDTELSGLMRNRILDRNDTPDQRFTKTVSSSRGYFIMQFGLSCFTRIDHLHYTNRTYNFYIFPQAHEELGDIDRSFWLQAHAIQFLSEHGFDFNKLFKYGISYLTFQEKKLVTKKLKTKIKASSSSESSKHQDTLTNAKGFLEVIELIIVSRKPLVGHNLILDLVQVINQFMEPLTDDYSSFKETCHSLFPLIYDTKYIAHSVYDKETLNNNQSRLNDLYCFLRQGEGVTQIKVDHLEGSVDENQLPHQAGYDAYMSGYCFIVLCEGYAIDKRKRLKLKKDELLESRMVSIAQNDQVMSEFANKIHFSYSLKHKCFDIGGVD